MKRTFVKKNPFILYPKMEEKDAYDKLFWKKEFLNTRFTPDFALTKSEEVCKHRTKEDFEMQNPQEFVKNLISPETNYNGLLILHGTGVGKTCSAIGITEGLRDYVHKNGKKMYIITPSENIRENFLKELVKTGCAKNNYDKKIIDEYYVFMGFGQFSNFIDRALKQNPEELDRHFSNSVIIIDEAHGIAKPPGKKEDAPEEDEEDDAEPESNEEPESEEEDLVVEKDHKRRSLFSVLTKTIIPHTKGLKLVLLSATPMKDNITEMADLLEILNVNDGRALPKEFRQKLIRFKDNKTDISDIVPDLLYYSKGYVSFARGNNPISFPAELKPPAEQLYSPRPTYAFNDGSPYDYTVPNPFNLAFQSQPYSYDLVKCPMGTLQYQAYEKLYALKNSAEKNYTQKLSWLSNILLPRTNIQTDADLKTTFQRTFPALRKKDVGDLNLRYDIKKDDVKLFQDHLADYSGKMFQFCKNIRQSPGIAFAYSEFITYGTKITAFLLELNGYIHYHPDLYSHLHNGQPTEAFLPHCSLLKFERTSASYMCAVCGERLNQHSEKTHDFLFSTYVLITGETEKRNRMLYIKNASLNPAQCKCGKLYEAHTEGDPAHSFESIAGGGRAPLDQRYGQVIKTIIGTRIIGQGVDFKWIRQVHVLEPWHNNTRIYQVIGRGLRHCSHADLPKAEREVMVFRYCSTPNEVLNTGVETMDEHVYARVIRKDIQVKQIERVLKENAVDCELNRHRNILPTDKDYSRECDYMPCDYTCQGYKNPITYNEIRVGRLLADGSPFVFDQLLPAFTAAEFAALPVVSSTTRAQGDQRFITERNGKFYLQEPLASFEGYTWKGLIEQGGKIVQHQASADDQRPSAEYLFLDIPLNGTPDASTYDIYFQKPLIWKVEKIIMKLFQRKIIYTLKTVMHYTKNELNIDDSIVYLALDSLLKNKTPMKDIHGREGYLINKGLFYIFQPTYLIDTAIPLYYREADIAFKPTSIPIPFVKKVVSREVDFNAEHFGIPVNPIADYYTQHNADPAIIELADLPDPAFVQEARRIITDLFQITPADKLNILPTRYLPEKDGDCQWQVKTSGDRPVLFVLLDFQEWKVWGRKSAGDLAGKTVLKSDILSSLTPLKTLADFQAFRQG